jgi:hypothetical protein
MKFMLFVLPTVPAPPECAIIPGYAMTERILPNEEVIDLAPGLWI